MKWKSLILMVLMLFSLVSIVEGSPTARFTYQIQNEKIILTPTVNDDTTHIKWIIDGKENDFYSETRWIPVDDINDHTTYLDSETYFVTLVAKNNTSNENNSFTRQLQVYVKQDKITPPTETEEMGFQSKIIQSLPEPLKGFFNARSQGELGLLLLFSLLLLGLLTRRKKIKKYVQLVRYND